MIKVHKNLYFVTSSVACSQFLALLSLFSFQGAGSDLFQDQIEMLFAEHFNLNLKFKLLVGPSGLEPPTSRLSVVRSSQLSYGPVPLHTSVRPLN